MRDELDDPELAGLPEALHEIAGAAGREAAEKLWHACRGSLTYIPSAAPAGHWLVACVGRQAADAICDHYRIIDADGRPQGVRLLIPLDDAGAMARAKTDFVRVMRSGRYSVKGAARLCGVHERTATRIVAEMRREQEARQGDLFADRQ